MMLVCHIQDPKHEVCFATVTTRAITTTYVPCGVNIPWLCVITQHCISCIKWEGSLHKKSGGNCDTKMSEGKIMMKPYMIQRHEIITSYGIYIE